MKTQNTDLITDAQRLVRVINKYGRELQIYDDGFGPLWVLRDSMGIMGIIRAQSREDAYSIAEDEFFPEADETIDELIKDYGFRRENIKIVCKPGETERADCPADYPFEKTGVRFVRWETRETPDPEAWRDNELFQESYGFRPNGPNERDTIKHGIYQRDLNGERLDLLTRELVAKLQLTIDTEDRA